MATSGNSGVLGRVAPKRKFVLNVAGVEVTQRLTGTQANTIMETTEGVSVVLMLDGFMYELMGPQLQEAGGG